MQKSPIYPKSPVKPLPIEPQPTYHWHLHLFFNVLYRYTTITENLEWKKALGMENHQYENHQCENHQCENHQYNHQYENPQYVLGIFGSKNPQYENPQCKNPQYILNPLLNPCL